jgi:ATP-dependent Clp protease ATP-binding subunit ClpA
VPDAASTFHDLTTLSHPIFPLLPGVTGLPEPFHFFFLSSLLVAVWLTLISRPTETHIPTMIVRRTTTSSLAAAKLAARRNQPALGPDRLFASLATATLPRPSASSSTTNFTIPQKRSFHASRIAKLPPGGGGGFPGGFPGGGMPGQQNKKPGETLQEYTSDLTALAKEGKLDPVIGRGEEIRRVTQILARRTKSNPVLVGEGE